MAKRPRDRVQPPTSNPQPSTFNLQPNNLGQKATRSRSTAKSFAIVVRWRK
ncbi:hypothetical protein BJP36_44055 [Moorena producens JHB]|uniref:Uncharacterized protein n=1 Tax=Moorena producens (strain JHB) TaxID=1454205 RepID=A0A9Q9UVY9_MOOP1|nr:hypothetical protein [Moorena producens]WAN69335.1 hypothetical protein BJP36_44055 [Moorena producens JHB]